MPTVLTIGLSVRPIAASDRLISIFLATLWARSAVVYHWMFFTEINQAAWAFGLLFLVQAVLFLNANCTRLHRPPADGVLVLNGEIRRVQFVRVNCAIQLMISWWTGARAFVTPDEPTFRTSCQALIGAHVDWPPPTQLGRV